MHFDIFHKTGLFKNRIKKNTNMDIVQSINHSHLNINPSKRFIL